MPTELREKAMSWWNNLTQLEKEEWCKKYANVLYSRSWNTLTGREIQAIYEAEIK